MSGSFEIFPAGPSCVVEKVRKFVLSSFDPRGAPRFPTMLSANRTEVNLVEMGSVVLSLSPQM